MSLVGILIVCVSGSTVISGGRFVHGTDLIEFVCLSPDLKPTVCFGINHHDSRGTKSNNTRETKNHKLVWNQESQLVWNQDPQFTRDQESQLTWNQDPQLDTSTVQYAVHTTTHKKRSTTRINSVPWTHLPTPLEVAPTKNTTRINSVPWTHVYLLYL